jgi:hypothetical protein
MKNTIKSTITACVLAAAGVSFSASTASAYQVFFGESLSISAIIPLASYSDAAVAEQQFLRVLSGVSTESFEGLATGATAPLSLNFAGAGAADLSGGSGTIETVAQGTTNGVGRYGTSGTNFLEVTAGGTGNFVIDFSTSTAALGFYGVDIGDFGGQLQIQLNDTANTILMVNNTIGSGGSTDGSVLFFGIVADDGDELFTQASFLTSTGGGDVFAFDDITVGSLAQVVPEPGTLAMLSVGLAGVTMLARRQRKA